jgi:hypothetical protein
MCFDVVHRDRVDVPVGFHIASQSFVIWTCQRLFMRLPSVRSLSSEGFLASTKGMS